MQQLRDRLARLIRKGGKLAWHQTIQLQKLGFWQRPWQMIDPLQASCADDWRVRPQDWPETRYMAKGVEEGRPSSWFEFIRK